MFKTLYSKLVVTLLVIVFVLAGIGFFALRYSSEMYQQEASQKLNRTLAKNMVAEERLLTKQGVNEKALKHLLHMLMVINPSIEIYLLDTRGDILSYHASSEKIKRKNVSLSPIKKFLSGDHVYPLMGDDPRNVGRQKVFSVARIPEKGKLEGYLYIVLAGENHDTVFEQIKNSYILSNSVVSLVLMFAFVLIVGLGIFALLTQRLKRLTDIIRNYSGISNSGENTEGDDKENQLTRYPVKNLQGDEVEQLGVQFNQMADRLDAQILKLKNNDNQRRELIANVSHDLRTPLATLQSYIETLSIKEPASQQEKKHYLEIALAQSKRLSTLVDELFELAKLDSCESVVYAEPFSLGELMHDIGQKFQLRAKDNNIELSVRCQDTSIWVHADIGMLQRVLENLIENALRHTPNGGKISLGFTAEGEQVLIKVADTGHGIPEDELEHIFDRFYRVDKSRTSVQEPHIDSNIVSINKLVNQSSGLGLAITKRILELHGSKIKVESIINKGTVFSFPMQVYAA
ncbi:Two-component system sensor histidine kinase [hydrothermal vent metagenome]|uniref:histidine kinase n=1 Tax=hydrothermal vent metagenome TaxID=652676 RepID=A0A3B1AYD2_9ZZZZ